MFRDGAHAGQRRSSPRRALPPRAKARGIDGSGGPGCTPFVSRELSHSRILSRRETGSRPAPENLMPLFSTVIPVFNRAQLISATLDSVLAQELPDQEVIVVDDGSSDGTLETLVSYGDRIRVLEQKNSGPAVARNLGIRD